MLDDLNNQELHKKAEGALQKILNKNPEVDFTVLAIIYGSHKFRIRNNKNGYSKYIYLYSVLQSRKLYTNLNSSGLLHPVRQDSFFPIGIEHPEWG